MAQWGHKGPQKGRREADEEVGVRCQWRRVAGHCGITGCEGGRKGHSQGLWLQNGQGMNTGLKMLEKARKQTLPEPAERNAVLLDCSLMRSERDF